MIKQQISNSLQTVVEIFPKHYPVQRNKEIKNKKNQQNSLHHLAQILQRPKHRDSHLCQAPRNSRECNLELTMCRAIPFNSKRTYYRSLLSHT